MKRTATAALVAAAMLASSPVVVSARATAAEASASASSTADAATAWAAVGDFCAIADWHPAVASCEVADHDGTPRRTLTLAGDGGTIVEDLVSRDDDQMQYTYRIIESPLPVSGYESTIGVSPDGSGSVIEWTGTFEPSGASEEEAVAVMTGIYEAGVAGIVEAAKN